MRGLDTNVLVRFVTQDDPRQARRAREVIEASVEEGHRLYVSSIVLCELVWVLRGAYGHGRDEISRVLAAILETPELIVEDRDLARRAVADYDHERGDFADLLLGHRNQAAGCETTLTFDRDLRRCAGFRLI